MVANGSPPERTDCRAVVALLLARLPVAAAILTAEGRIELLNQAMADALDTSVDELLGADLFERHSNAVSLGVARAELALLASGARPSASVRLDCGRLSELDIEPVAGATGFFLATAATTSDGTDELAAFEVSTSPQSFGHVLRHTMGGVSVEGTGEARCHELLCGISDCCAECPATAISDASPVASRVTAARGPDGDCFIVTARRSGPDRAMVTAIRIDRATRAKLVAARLDAASSAAGLSAREKQVLGLLLLGKELAEIAAELGISHRTVRFHQYNLLEKLEIESRADLARLLL